MDNNLTPQSGQFGEILSIIDGAHSRALKAVNAELIQTDSNVLGNRRLCQ